MDEQWACPKCGFANEYYAGYCVSCSEPRPAETAETSTPEKETLSSDNQWGEVPPPAIEELRRFAAEGAYKPATPIPTPAPMPSPPSSGRRFSGRPLTSRRISFLVFWIILAIIVPTVGRCLGRDSSTATTEQWELTYPGTIDSAQVAAFAEIDFARNELLALSNTRWESWLADGQSEFPSKEYLVADELLEFQAKVAAMPQPSSEELRALNWIWTTSLLRLVLAEKSLAAGGSQANLDARALAWEDEATAYQALYTFLQSR